VKALTTALSIALVALVVGVSARDWRPVDEQHLQAQSAARVMGATLLGRGEDDAWRVRVDGAMRTRCFAVDVAHFRADPQHGYVGLHPTSCP